jgi:hypothetical protein
MLAGRILEIARPRNLVITKDAALKASLSWIECQETSISVLIRSTTWFRLWRCRGNHSTTPSQSTILALGTRRTLLRSSRAFLIPTFKTRLTVSKSRQNSRRSWRTRAIKLLRNTNPSACLPRFSLTQFLLPFPQILAGCLTPRCSKLNRPQRSIRKHRQVWSCSTTQLAKLQSSTVMRARTCSNSWSTYVP